jgi:hypothetical protein
MVYHTVLHSALLLAVTATRSRRSALLHVARPPHGRCTAAAACRAGSGRGRTIGAARLVLHAPGSPRPAWRGALPQRGLRIATVGPTVRRRRWTRSSSCSSRRACARRRPPRHPYPTPALPSHTHDVAASDGFPLKFLGAPRGSVSFCLPRSFFPGSLAGF